MTALAPWESKKDHAAYVKRVRQEHQQCKKDNPTLMKRLAKLTDVQLDRVYAAVLELEPPSAKRDYELRLLRDLEYFRSAPKPKRGGKVPRLRLPAEKHGAPLCETPIPLGGLRPPHLNEPCATASASPPPTPAIPTPPKPSNVVLFAGKCFRNGRVTPRWIGGEV